MEKRVCIAFASFLHDAVKNGDINEVKRLAGSGADVNDIDEAGWPPLHYAVWGGDIGKVRLLIDKGADINAMDNKILL